MKTIVIQSHVKTALMYKLKYQNLCHELKMLDEETEKIRARLIQITCRKKNIQVDKDNVFSALVKELEKMN